MPETTTHLVLRTFLFQLLRFAFGESCGVGSDPFVYWRASDPKTCLAPDVFVKLGVRAVHFDSWKTWERGTPDLAVEIARQSDRDAWDEKLVKYMDLGVHEVVRFDSEAHPGARLRVWDRVDDDLVERVLSSDSAESFVLGPGRFWVIGDVDGSQRLRVAEDAAGHGLLLSALETQTRAKESETRAKEAETRANEAETRMRMLAEARVRELEAELRGKDS